MANHTALRRVSKVLGHVRPLFISQTRKPFLQRNLVSSASVLDTRRRVSVLDSSISYLDTIGDSGVGDKTVLFLHGNPTCAYLWRNVIPHVRGVARCLAPDLIGMGDSGKSGTGSYRFVDHFRYLSKWIDQMNLPKKISIVCHDWGSGLGLHWCHLNQDRVESIIFMEALVNTVPSWDYFPETARKVFQAIRSPAGEEMVLKKNFFVERLLPGAILRDLAEEEMNHYRAPYLQEGESRRPTLTWPREIPIDTDGPEDVCGFVRNYSKWLATSGNVPKLYIDAEPGFFSPGIRRTVAKWQNVKNVVVKGSHFIQEDSPVEIGQAVASFLLNDVYK